MTGFLTLDDLVLPPPLPAIVSLLLVSGLVGLGETGLRRFRAAPDVAERCAAFAVAAALCGAIVHGLALAHLATLPVLRILAAVVVLMAPRAWSVFRGMATAWREGWREASIWQRIALGAVAATVLFLALAALGPVTDADSLDYHLGAPLDWLRHGGVTVEPHWLHARITGLGEALNMLGLAAGTDGLGALLQVSGLVMLVTAIGSLGGTARDRTFGMLLALPPAIVPLATAQKPQLLPVAAVVVAMILARRARSGFDLALVFGCIGFAMASKYSFLVSGGVVAVAAMYWAWEKGRLGLAVQWAAISLGVLALPVLARNFYLYGDPVSPFLEAWRAHPNAEVVRFAGSLRDAGAPHTFAGVGRFVVGLVAPGGAGDAQTVLGIGLLALLLVGWTGWSGVVLACGATVATFTIWLGQMAPRYLLEPYLWLAIAAVLSPWHRLKTILSIALTAQTLAVAAMAMVGAWLLFPGALTPGWRDQTMLQSTFGYEEARWLDRQIPQDATIMSESRAYALYPRPFAIAECAACGPAPLLELFRPADAAEHGANVLVVGYPMQGTIADGCVLRRIAGPERLRYATRNPFNKAAYKAVALGVVCH